MIIHSCFLCNVQVKGYFEQQSGERIAFPSIVGKWDDSMTAVLADGTSRLLWQKAPPPPDPTRCATALAMPMSCSQLSDIFSTAFYTKRGIPVGQDVFRLWEGNHERQALASVALMTCPGAHTLWRETVERLVHEKAFTTMS